jgi:hypothetical protein
MQKPAQKKKISTVPVFKEVSDYGSLAEFGRDAEYVALRLRAQLSECKNKVEALAKFHRKVFLGDFDPKNPVDKEKARSWTLSFVEVKDNLTAIECGRFRRSSEHCRSCLPGGDAAGFKSRTLGHQRFDESLKDVWYSDHAGQEEVTGSTKTLVRANGDIHRFTSESIDDLAPFVATDRLRESLGSLKSFKKLGKDASKDERRAVKKIRKKLEFGEWGGICNYKCAASVLHLSSSPRPSFPPSTPVQWASPLNLNLQNSMAS